ncbi:hypothetical protein Hhel01_00065 [Haloferula helveola]
MVRQPMCKGHFDLGTFDLLKEEQRTPVARDWGL